jgi:hypothetical protein
MELHFFLSLAEFFWHKVLLGSGNTAHQAYKAERTKRGAPEGRGASYLAGGGWSVLAQ